MTIERRRPLPAGRYWVDVFPVNRPAWEGWLKMAASRGAAIEVSQHFEPVDGADEHDFAIFTTSSELVWPDKEMGFSPNVAGPEIRSSDDTVQKPPPSQSVSEQVEALTAGVGKALAVVVGVAVVAAITVAAVAASRRRKG